MIKFYNNLSPTTKLLIQSFLAVLGSVLAGVLTAVYQSYILSSQINLAVLWNVAVVTFALLFGKAMHDWIPAHAQQLLQAAQDEKAALYDALQRAQNITNNAVSAARQQQNVALVQAQQLPQQPVLKSEDVQALSQQLAVNLMNMAANNSKVPASVDPIPMPVKPAEDAYVDPLKVSMQLPVYNPPPPTNTVTNQSQPITFPAVQKLAMP